MANAKPSTSDGIRLRRQRNETGENEMPINMSYCVFENTYRALQEAQERMNEVPVKDLSESEQKYRKYLLELCSDLASDYDDEID